MGRGGLEGDVTATPTGSVIAREHGVFGFKVGEVATERTDEYEPVFKHAEITRRHNVFKFGDVVGAVIFARGVEDALGRHIGNGAVGVAQSERTEVGVIEITTALIHVEAVPERGAVLGRIPVAGVGADTLEGQQIKITALGLELIIETATDGELKFTDRRFFDVSGGGAETLELVVAEILVIPEFAVGLFEVRVGGAVREILRDVDEHGVGAAVDGVVAVDFDLVGVARDFEEKRLTDAVAEGEGEVFGDLGLRGFAAGPEISGRLRGDFETNGTGEGVVVAAGGNFKTVDHRLAGVAHAGASDGFAANEITVGRSTVALRAFRAKDISEIQNVTRAEGRGIVYPERRKQRIGVVGTVADTGGGLLRGGGCVDGQNGVGEGGFTIPSGHLIGEKRRESFLLSLSVFALGAERRGVGEIVRARDEEGFLSAPLVFAVGIGVFHHAGDADGGLIVNRAIQVEGAAVFLPRAELHLDLVNRLGGERLLGDSHRGAAELGGAEENGVGAAGEVETVERVAIGVVVKREEIPHRVIRFAGSGAADRDVERGREAEALVDVVARIVGGVHGPLHGLREISDVEGVEKFLGEHRVSNGRVLKIGVKAAAGEGAGSDETFITTGVNLKRRELDRGFCDGGGR